MTSKSNNINGDLNWQKSEYGIPDQQGRSEGEVHVIAVDKGNILDQGWVDVSFTHDYYECIPADKFTRCFRFFTSVRTSDLASCF